VVLIFNLKALKIILFLIIITFFLPFFVISCGEAGDDFYRSMPFSGFEAAFGKNVEGITHQEGSLFALALIIPSVIMFVLTFFKQTFLLKNIFIIAPIFNIIAGITFIIAARIIFGRRIADYLGEFNVGALDGLLNFSVGYGFILYLLLNIALLVFASVNYFKNNTGGVDL